MIAAKANAETLYHLVSTPEGLAKWWAEDVFAVSEGTCSLGFFNRDTVYRLMAESKVSGKQIVWHCETGKEWAGTRLIFDIQGTGNSTVLRFTHAGWQAETDYFLSCNTTWGELMFRLGSVAEGRNPGPLFKKSGLSY